MFFQRTIDANNWVDLFLSYGGQTNDSFSYFMTTVFIVFLYPSNTRMLTLSLHLSTAYNMYVDIAKFLLMLFLSVEL